MSDQLIAALAGAFVGIVGSIVGNRFVASLGRLWCEPSGFEITFMNEMDAYGERGIVNPNEAKSVDYSFNLDLFNGRDMPTGLRNLKVVLVCKDSELISEPIDRATRNVDTARGIPVFYYEEMGVINLPPRQWVRKEFQGSFDNLEGVNVGEWKRAELIGEWPRRWRKTFTKKIAER